MQQMGSKNNNQKCVLCESGDLAFIKALVPPEFFYFHCHNCDFIFLDPPLRLSVDAEKARYQFHEYEDTEAYRSFYAPFLTQLEWCLAQSPKPQRVLDYGSGPNSILAKILSEKGLEVNCFDPLFANNPELLQRNYDLIVSTEVFEHFFDPTRELQQLTSLLTAEGRLAVMTSFHRGLEHFQNWHYRRDPTHVSFYSEKTFDWISNKYHLEVKAKAHPVFIGQLKMK
jgi:SAM-dependent methyltransferase